MSLAFSFLSPALLYFLPLVLVPLIIHFFNRRRYTTVRWAAMEFLLRAMRKQKRRMRMESFLLVLLRMAAIACLVVACARPMMEEEVLSKPTTGGNACYVLALDTSYSMAWQDAGRTLLSETIASAKDRLARLDEADRLVILNCADYAQVVFDDHIADDARLRAREILDSLSPTCTSLDVRALFTAVGDSRTAHEDEELPVNVVVFTDVQARDWLDVDRSADPEITDLLSALKKAGVSLTVEHMGRQYRDNAAVIDLEVEENLVVLDAPVVIRAVVENFSSRSRETFTLDFLVDGHSVQGRTIEIDPNETMTVGFRHIFRDPGPHGVTVELKSDRLAVDNRHHLALNVRKAVNVLLVDGNDAVEERDRATFYLDAALRRDAAELMEVLSPFVVQSIPAGLLTEPMIDDCDVLVLADVDRIDMVPALRNFLNRGGSLLVFLGPNVDQEFYNAELFQTGRGVCDLELLGIAGDATGRYGVFMEPKALEHPVVRFVLEQKNVQFEGPPIWRYYRTKPGDDVRVVTAYQDLDGSAAIVEQKKEQGVVVVVTTTADETWTNFPKWPDYVSILYELLSYQAAASGVKRSLFIGWPFRCIYPPVVYAEEVRISAPEGRVTRTSLRDLPDSNDFLLLYERTEEPGIYEVVFSRQRTIDPFLRSRYPDRDLFAVNLPGGESDLETVPSDVMKAAYGEAAPQFTDAASDATETARQHAGRPELWRPFLFAMLLFFVVESVCATLFGRRKR